MPFFPGARDHIPAPRQTPILGIERCDVAAMRSVASRSAHDDLVLHHQRRGRDVAAALSRVIQVDPPQQAPAFLVQGNHVIVLAAKEDLPIAYRHSPISYKTRNTARWLRVLVTPDLAPRRRVQRE